MALGTLALVKMALGKMTLGKMALGKMALGTMALRTMGYWVKWHWVHWHWVKWNWVNCHLSVKMINHKQPFAYTFKVSLPVTLENTNLVFHNLKRNKTIHIKNRNKVLIKMFDHL